MHVKLASSYDEGVMPILQAVREGMRAARLPKSAIDIATTELLHAKGEGTLAVAHRLVSVNSSVADELADLL